MEKPACVAEFLAIAYADPSKKVLSKKIANQKNIN
jgi:hypothetical protein